MDNNSEGNSGNEKSVDVTSRKCCRRKIKPRTLWRINFWITTALVAFLLICLIGIVTSSIMVFNNDHAESTMIREMNLGKFRACAESTPLTRKNGLAYYATELTEPFLFFKHMSNVVYAHCYYPKLAPIAVLAITSFFIAFAIICSLSAVVKVSKGWFYGGMWCLGVTAALCAISLIVFLHSLKEAAGTVMDCPVLAPADEIIYHTTMTYAGQHRFCANDVDSNNGFHRAWGLNPLWPEFDDYSNLPSTIEWIHRWRCVAACLFASHFICIILINRLAWFNDFTTDNKKFHIPRPCEGLIECCSRKNKNSKLLSENYDDETADEKDE